ncbi:MAG: TetR/AcrR family transcriptional regulator [Polyangia bacterium]|jgi:AcrR family transcriptional regulator
MSRPTIIQDDTIVEAARDIFLKRGIQGTTAEVAKRAGVSQGTIFRRFKSKEDLFSVAMARAGDDEIPATLQHLSSCVGEGCVEDRLLDLGSKMLAFYRELVPLHMMSWSNRAPRGGRRNLDRANRRAIRALKQMSAYLEAEIRLGRLPRLDADVTARVFLGSLHSYAILEIFYHVNDELPLEPERFVRGLVRLVCGTRKRRSAATPKRKA